MGARTGAVKLPHLETAGGKESSNLWKWRVEFLWRIASRKKNSASREPTRAQQAGD
jgi:hypothetical protein